MINFLYNINKDAENWVNTVQDTSPSWGINYEEETKMVPEVLKAKILKLNKEKAVVAVKEYFESQPCFRAKKEVITAEIRSIEEVWKSKEKEFFNILESLTNKPIFSSEFTAYFTTMFICPYDKEKYRWFMLSMWHSLPFQITTICHEIFHFQFLYYYKKFCMSQQLDEKQIEDLKESLTVLLNTEEFDRIILSQDLGYPHHQWLRKKILDTWQQNKDFYIKDRNGFAEFLKKIIETSIKTS